MRKTPVIRKKNSAQVAFARFLFIVAIFVIWIGVIGVRLVHLQVNQSDWLREKALDQRRDEVKNKQLRGSILDRESRALALSVKVKSLSADPAEIEDVQTTAQRVAAALKVKPQEIFKNLQEAKDKGKRFVWLARKLDEDAVQKLNQTLRDDAVKKPDEPRFAGLHWREEQKRSYPYGTLASQIVGFSNLDDAGQAGIEMSQEENLHGAVVKTWRVRDRLGRVYDEDEVEREPPKDVVLTVSRSIQYKVEEALKAGVEAAQAKSGTAIVLDPKTGEVLAMANYPTFDPNKFADVAPELVTNRAVQNVYSPGSVFKLVTYGSALQENLISPDAMLNCGNGVIEVAGHEFKDPHCTHAMSYTDALAISSNIGAIKTGLGVGKERFYGYVKNFGFGEQTGIELPAESRGLLRAPQNWSGDSLASMSIGYEIGVTALQTASAYAAIANDGVRVKPHIIKEIRQADGKVFSAAEPEKSQVVSTETARKLRKMLQKVVLKGTGQKAQLNGYSSAGKTGTAWKYDAKLKKINESKYVSSFVGMCPVENPAVVIAVVLDEPQVANRNGGQVSAPIFRNIAEQILPELGIAPDGGVHSDTAQDIPNELDTKSAPAKKEKSATAANGKNPSEKSEKVLERKTEKSAQEKEPAKQKTVADAKAKGGAKNKSSTEKAKNKT